MYDRIASVEPSIYMDVAAGFSKNMADIWTEWQNRHWGWFYMQEMCLLQHVIVKELWSASCMIVILHNVPSVITVEMLPFKFTGYRSRGSGFDSRCYQIFWGVVCLEQGPLSLMRITEELLEWKSSGSGSRKPRLTAVGCRCADHATPSTCKSWH
jgi:hypothetical protein